MTYRTSRRRLIGAGLSLPILGAPLLAGQERTPLPTATRALPPKNGKRMLVLGGTRFLGPAIVHAALERGYEVTLFNRGRSNPDMFPELETLIGDRNTGDLAALEGGEWDFVVDTSCYLPSHARAAAEILKDRVNHYVVISSISVYADGHEGYVMDEDAPVGQISAEDIARVTQISEVMTDGGIFYGPLKALSEQAIEEVMPGRSTSLRPGVICGKDDPSDRLPYWVVRASQGGELLCPGDPDQDFQFTDVNDLGIWSVEFAEQRIGGNFNAIGFEAKVTLQEFLHGCKIVLGRNDTTYTWCDEAFLLENGVRPFSELPFWLPEGAAHHYANLRGLEAGMRFRPIADTIRETIDWHDETRGAEYQWRYYGMQPEREVALLEAWHARGAEAPAEIEVEPVEPTE